MVRNPVMFIVEIGAVMTTYGFIAGIRRQLQRHQLRRPDRPMAVVHGALRELRRSHRRGARQGPRRRPLRRTRTETIARKLQGGIGGTEVAVPAPDLRKGDIVVCEAGDVIPSDGTIVEGIASVDESAITGESAPVIREAAATAARSPVARVC